jgi:hypothetical protein
MVRGRRQGGTYTVQQCVLCLRVASRGCAFAREILFQHHTMGSRWNTEAEEVARPVPLPVPYPSQPPLPPYSPVHAHTRPTTNKSGSRPESKGGKSHERYSST